MRLLPTLFALALATPCMAAVVINEIMYNAPDDLDDLEFVELLNTSDAPADISNWSFTKGLKLKFPANTKIAANGYLVVARNSQRFAEHYKVPVAAIFTQKLSNDGETIELSDANGKV